MNAISRVAVGGTGVFVLVASISLLVDRLMAGRLLIKKRVQQRVLQRGGGQREEANKEDRQNERTSGEPQHDIQPNTQRDESLPTAAANPDAEATGGGPQSENLPAEHESESAAYMPNTGEPPRVPWNPEDALGEHSRSNSSDNTRVSPVH